MDNEKTLGHGTHADGHNHDHSAREGHGPECGCGAHEHNATNHAGHDHGAGCGCGHDHKTADHAGHDHGAGCGCGHDHKTAGHAGHDHGPDCGCEAHGHTHSHGPGCGCEGYDGDSDGPNYENGLSIAENNVLMALLERGGLPVARFSLSSSKEQEAYAVAMSPVYIADPGDSLETIKEYGAIYAGMEEKGLIELDYEFPLPGYPYREYHESWAWRHFVETAAEAKQRGFTFDTPRLELGGITMTEHGHEVVDDMIG